MTPALTPRRRFLGRMTAGAALLASGAPGFAQSGWRPSRTMRIVVPSTPGGISDNLARAVAAHLAGEFGQPCVVENKPGGGGTTGSLELLRAPADGHTLLTSSPGPQATAYALFPKLPYKATDFAALSGMVRMPNVLVVHPGVPAKSVPELVAYLRANPNKLNYGGPIGSSLHLSGLWFTQLTGTSATHVPYPGSAQAGTALMAGEIQFMFDNLASYLPHIRAGKVRALGVSTREASPALPDLAPVNTALAELRPFEVSTWVGLVMAAGTPQDALTAINDKLRGALATPAAQRAIDAVAGRVDYLPVAQAEAFLKDEVQRWSGIIRSAGLQLEQS